VLRIRRVMGLWPFRRKYEVELWDDAGQLIRSARTGAPNAFLVGTAGVHSTDARDWVHAADRAFDRGSSSWITNPFTTE
jgi:hypothetical protein